MVRFPSYEASSRKYWEVSVSLQWFDSPPLLGQLEEVLWGDGLPAVVLCVGEIDDGGRPLGQELVADLLQHLNTSTVGFQSGKVI